MPLTLLSAAAVAAGTLAINPPSPAQAVPTGYTCSGFSLGSLASWGQNTVGGVAVCIFQSDGSTTSTPWSMPVEVTSFDVLAVGAGGGGGGRGPIQTYAVAGTTVKSAAGGGAGGGGEIRLLAGATGSTVAVSVGSFGAAGAVESAGLNGGDTTVLIGGTAAVTSMGGIGGAAEAAAAVPCSTASRMVVMAADTAATWAAAASTGLAVSSSAVPPEAGSGCFRIRTWELAAAVAAQLLWRDLR